MSRYDTRITKLIQAMSDMSQYYEIDDKMNDSIINDYYPWNLSFDEVVIEYLGAFHDNLITKIDTDWLIKKRSESIVSNIYEYELVAIIRRIYICINDLYKYDKERFLSQAPNCTDKDLLEGISNFYKAAINEYGTLQQKARFEERK